jgi:hypothetical protein
VCRHSVTDNVGRRKVHSRPSSRRRPAAESRYASRGICRRRLSRGDGSRESTATITDDAPTARPHRAARGLAAHH